jgi:hypothetical protein
VQSTTLPTMANAVARFTHKRTRDGTMNEAVRASFKGRQPPPGRLTVHSAFHRPQIDIAPQYCTGRHVWTLTHATRNH